jgi:hypothetical protein
LFYGRDLAYVPDAAFEHLAGGGRRRSDELHSLRLYPRQDLLDLLASTGFQTRCWPAMAVSRNSAAATPAS